MIRRANNSVGTVTSLGAAHPRNLVQFYGRGKRLLSSLKRRERLWDSFRLLDNDYQDVFTCE